MKKLRALSFMLLALCFACNSSGKEESKLEPGSWYVTVRGKVGFPQQGKIVIQEIKENGAGWQDTIQLKSNYTFAKKVKLSEPGYYRINFYNKQILNVILDKNDIEINADGNQAQGFFEIKGSPDLDLINQVQTMLAETNKSPEFQKLNDEFNLAAQNKDQKKMLELQQQ
ncbi:MAG: DUF4369 domain-containing protein, partial [Bacteroidota bacterium]